MAGLPKSALDNHLHQYDSISEAGSDTAGGNSERRGASSDDAAVDDVAGPEERSAWNLVFTTMSPGCITTANNAVTSWWRQRNPMIVQFIHEYGALLLNFLAPFSPRATRRAGYRCAVDDLLRALDRLDSDLPGGERGWTSRWRNRSRNRYQGESLSAGGASIYRAVGGVGVVAAAVMFAAVSSWCSWRRSSPGWPILLMEVAVGSAGAAHYVARGDGHEEARSLEAKLTALERSLRPFFRGVQACMRMVRCSQTLSFGLRLSVPMPPVARMEGRLPPTGSGSGPGQAGVALRELRAVLMEALEEGVKQVNGFDFKKQFDGTAEAGGSTGGPLECERQGSGSTSTPLLTGLAGTEKELIADLHRFVAAVAASIDRAMAGPEVWGIWWDSQLAGVTEAVERLALYFEAAAQRLEAAIGSDGLPPCKTPEPSTSGEVALAADALSSLRLHYEETFVRLFLCQRSVSTILRDPTSSRPDTWEVVRRDLADARALDCGDTLWRNVEQLVESLATEGGRSGADSSSRASSCSEHPSDTSRHLEAGVGWVSLATPREEGSRVFEGGSGDEGSENEPRVPLDSKVTDILVGVPSPNRSRRQGDHGESSHPAPQELVDEQSRAQLVGELDSVLRARPPPQTCEKHLPLESQQSLQKEVEGEIGDAREEEPPLDAPTPDLAPRFPVADSAGSRDLMSELRAQLSMAANAEIFSSDRLQVASSSNSGEGSSLAGHEEEHHDQTTSDAEGEPA